MSDEQRVAEAFLDSNVLLRHLLGDHAEHSPAATAVIARIERGELRAHLADTVVFETVFTLERSYRRARPDIRDAILALIDLPGIVLPEKQMLREALRMYADLNVPFADAYHAAVASHRKLDHILSLDRHFDRLPGITRIDPKV